MSRLSGHVRNEEDDRSERTRDFSGLFDPSTHLCGLVDDTLQGSRAVRLRLADQGEILLCPRRRRYHDLSTSIAGVHASPREPFRVEPLSAEEQRSWFSEPAGGRPVDELLWSTALYASAGRLTLGISMTDVLQLTRWPNLPRVPRTPNTARIAALLSCQPSSLTGIRGHLRVPRGEIAQVLSAALAAGYLRFVNRTESTAPPPEAESASLIGRLLRKLTGRTGAAA